VPWLKKWWVEGEKPGKLYGKTMGKPWKMNYEKTKGILKTMEKN
jgi:hypothetical protein